MRRWKPKSGSMFWAAIILLAASLTLVVILGIDLMLEFAQPPERWRIDVWLFAELAGLFLALLLCGVLVYRIAAALTLSYTMDRNGLYITWVGNRAVIPLDRITTIDSGVTDVRTPRNPLRWVGYFSGTARAPDNRPVNLFTTRAPGKSLVIYTTTEAYAVSPAERDMFVQELEQRRRLGAVKTIAPTTEPGRFFLYAFWHDPVVRWSLLLTFSINFLLLGILAWSYAEMAPMLDMRFDPAGLATEQRPRHQVLFLPMAAFGLSLLNTALGLSFYQRNRTSAQMLQVGSVMIQVLFGIALLAIIS